MSLNHSIIKWYEVSYRRLGSGFHVAVDARYPFVQTYRRQSSNILEWLTPVGGDRPATVQLFVWLIVCTSRKFNTFPYAALGNITTRVVV